PSRLRLAPVDFAPKLATGSPIHICGPSLFWETNHIFLEATPYHGPASPQAFFRAVVASPTQIGIGIKFTGSDDFQMKWIDCSRFGKTTGIWELGPIFSCDRWIQMN